VRIVAEEFAFSIPGPEQVFIRRGHGVVGGNNAETAIRVMGGRKPGVMTKRPKWAFASPVAGDAFIKSHGGEIVSWGRALDAAREGAAKKHR